MSHFVNIYVAAVLVLGFPSLSDIVLNPWVWNKLRTAKTISIRRENSKADQNVASFTVNLFEIERRQVQVHFYLRGKLYFTIFLVQLMEVVAD